MRWLEIEGQAQVTKATVNVVNRQCKHYCENGLPGLRDLGVAPYRAGQHSADDDS